jgi:hypothetical protein
MRGIKLGFQLMLGKVLFGLLSLVCGLAVLWGLGMLLIWRGGH